MNKLNWNNYKLNDFSGFNNEIKVIFNLYASAKSWGAKLKNLVLKELVFAFNRGFLDGYCCYRAYALVPKEIANKVTVITLDEQCTSYDAYDKYNKQIYTSNTGNYYDYNKIVPSIFVSFEDDLKEDINDIVAIKNEKIEEENRTTVDIPF